MGGRPRAHGGLSARAGRGRWGSAWAANRHRLRDGSAGTGGTGPLSRGYGGKTGPGGSRRARSHLGSQVSRSPRVSGSPGGTAAGGGHPGGFRW